MVVAEAKDSGAEHYVLRMDYTFSLQGALNEDSKGLSSAKE
jgi:hypothetical protein